MPQGLIVESNDPLIIHGDCIDVLPTLPPATVVFADPPDNRGLEYDGYDDKLHHIEYMQKLGRWSAFCVKAAPFGATYFSIAHPYQLAVGDGLNESVPPEYGIRTFIWHYTFGQHNTHDFGTCFRPIFRILHKDAVVYPDQVRIPSARQKKYKDKRADPRGRVPGDVWNFPRVCGTFKERRKWFPTQHPEALVERCIKFSVDLKNPLNHLVIDPFLGSGTTLRVCQRLGVPFVGIETSEKYCRKVAQETGAKVVEADEFTTRQPRDD